MTAINSNRAIRGPVTAVPVVAGTGVRFVKDVENNRVVAEVDETVLWEATNGATSAQLSESIFNFETIKIFYAGGERYGNRPSMELAVTSSVLNNGIQISDWFINSAGTFVVMANGYYTVSQTGDELTGTNITHMWFSVPNFTYSGTGSSGVKIFKVVGINRIASN